MLIRTCMSQNENQCHTLRLLERWPLLSGESRCPHHRPPRGPCQRTGPSAQGSSWTAWSRSSHWPPTVRGRGWWWACCPPGCCPPGGWEAMSFAFLLPVDHLAIVQASLSHPGGMISPKWPPLHHVYVKLDHWDIWSSMLFTRLKQGAFPNICMIPPHMGWPGTSKS